MTDFSRHFADSPTLASSGSFQPRLSRPFTAGLWRLVLLAALLGGVSAASASPAPMQDPDPDPGARRILVSLEQHRLWLVEGEDTLMSAPVAIGRRETFRWAGRVYDWRTPRGERKVLGKRPTPVWTVPQWHYYERAANEGLRLVEMARDMRYSLADRSYLRVLNGEVVRVLGDQYWPVPTGAEIVIDGTLYVPPMGTAQRRVPGVLGTRALDLGDGYLIHGTNPHNRNSIGTAASHGCVRMANEDVERLFDLVSVGTLVLIY